jgi:predicted lipoprotein with Yx(FWY)xxD motif
MKSRWLGTILVVLAIAAPMMTRGVAAQDAAFLAVSENDDLGAFLTDAGGKTLYLFTPDTTAGESTCYDQCAENWPPLAPAEGMTLPEGVPGELTTVERTDGSQQVAYNGIPLYYFASDAAAGDTNGQGVGGVWFVVAPGAMHGDYPAAPGEGTPVPASTLRVGFTEELGPFLADAEGRTVYLFLEDKTKGESACYDDCATAWPPVLGAEGATLPPGIQGTLGTISRTDGSSQLSYNDIPLYYYSADKEPGDTNGQDVHDVWYIVTPGMQFGDEPHEDEEAEEAEAGEASATPTS